MTDETFSIELPSESIEVRDLAQREVDMRLLPWGKQVETVHGLEEFRNGAFDDAKPSDVYLYGPEHEVRFGAGQNGQPKVVRVPVGRATRLGKDNVGPVATFKVARTPAGDEALGLMADGIVSGVSVEFAQVAGGTEMTRQGTRHVRIHHRARLMGATPTHRPAYGEQAAVLAVRSQEEAQVADETAAVAAPTPAVPDELLKAFGAVQARADAQEKVNAQILERLDTVTEQTRSAFTIPAKVDEPKAPPRGDWASIILRALTGERVSQEQMRTLDDVITSDNLGVVPPTYLTELIGVIDNSRPFLQSTRRLPTPATGLKLIVPKINQRPEVAVQTAEKQELASQKTKIGVEDFDAVTIGGAGDLSIQLLKRSSPEFLSLWVELLAEQYAIVSEDMAVTALADAIGGFGAANPMNPANLNLGPAYIAAFDAIRRGPDTIWLSTEAVAEFIDAKATTTNQPLYSNINLNATAAGGVSGTISGLRAVHVPVLDAHGAFAIVGPSSGFAWAEDGTYTLQVDNAANAGRDVALVGMLWFAPWYPAAFTAYNVAS